MTANELNDISGIIGWGIIAIVTIGVALAILFYYKKKLLEVRQSALEADMDIDTGVSNEKGFLKHLTELVCSVRGGRARDVQNLPVCLYVFHIMYEPRVSSFGKRLILKTVVRSLRANTRSADLVGRLKKNVGEDLIGLAFTGKKSLSPLKMRERMEKARRAVYHGLASLPSPINRQADIDECVFFLQEGEGAVVFLNRAMVCRFSDST